MRALACAGVVAVALWPAAGVTAGTSESARVLHLDHVPLVVRDLPAAIAQFQSLGFTIKPGRPHTNGIEDASVKFADGSYLELITAHDANDPISREYADMLKTQEGAAYAFLRDDTSGRFSQSVTDAGGARETAGPFAFVHLPLSWQLPRLQLIQYIAPADDRVDTLHHANGATRLAGIWAAGELLAPALKTAFDLKRAQTLSWTFNDRTLYASTLADDTCLLVASFSGVEGALSRALGVLVEVSNDSTLQPFLGAHVETRGGVRWLPASDTHGLRIGFVTREQWTHLSCVPAGQ